MYYTESYYIYRRRNFLKNKDWYNMKYFKEGNKDILQKQNKQLSNEHYIIQRQKREISRLQKIISDIEETETEKKEDYIGRYTDVINTITFDNSLDDDLNIEEVTHDSIIINDLEAKMEELYIQNNRNEELIKALILTNRKNARRCSVM